MIDVIIAMIYGGMCALLLFEGTGAGMMPGAIRYQPAGVPDILRMILASITVVVFLSGIGDFRGSLCLAGEPRREAQGKFVTEGDESVSLKSGKV